MRKWTRVEGLIVSNKATMLLFKYKLFLGLDQTKPNQIVVSHKQKISNEISELLK